MDMDARFRISQEILSVMGQGSLGMKGVYAECDKLIGDGFLLPAWTDVFSLRPKRSPMILNANPSSPQGILTRGVETLAIMRMIRIAEADASPEMKRYARDWLNTMFDQSVPQFRQQLRPDTVKLLDQLKTLYDEKVPSPVR
jgi:hypothetical protein